MEFERKAGTTVADTYNFVLRILTDIGEGTPERRRLFTFDNLLAHTNPVVIGLILQWGHCVCLRAQYYPVNGAVEYVFNTLQHNLTIKMANITNDEQLRTEVNNTIGSILNFVNYF